MVEPGGKDLTPRERPSALAALAQQSTLTDSPGTHTVDAGLGLDRGSMLDRFVVLDKIGSGGMGVVLSAFDPHLDRKVAIKLLRPRQAIDVSSREARDRLVREAKALARISHPNVITVHDVGMVGDEVFVAMEYIDGGTLKDTLAFRQRDWRGVLGLFVQAGRGLAAAHRKGMVHRDFKPDNVLVDRDLKRVLVTDFGLVSLREEGSGLARLVPPSRRLSTAATLTETGAVLGTPAYMAPEQHLGQRADERSDQFSFCAALWEALHGERPFAGETLDELAGNVIAGRLIRRATRTVPGWLRDVVARGLSAEPDRRFSSMDALLEELSRHAPRAGGWRGAAVAAAVAAIAVAVGVAAIGGAGGRDSQVARAQIAQLEAQLERQNAELARAHIELALSRDRLARARRAETERQAAEQRQLEAARRTKLDELLALEEQMMVLAPGGRAPGRQAVTTETETETAALEVARRDEPISVLADHTPRSDILAALAEVRPAVIRCGEVRDFASNRTFAKWERAELSRFAGEVAVKLRIRPDGGIESVRATGQAPDKVLRCVETKVRAASFARSQLGRVTHHVFAFPGAM